MKIKSLGCLAAMLLAIATLSGCASDRSYDQTFNSDMSSSQGNIGRDAVTPHEGMSGPVGAQKSSSD